MPSLAKSKITSSTSAIISGSRADVGSSNNIISGSKHSALAIATLCCCPPESKFGFLKACSGIFTLSKKYNALSIASFFEIPKALIGPKVRFSITDK